MMMMAASSWRLPLFRGDFDDFDGALLVLVLALLLFERRRRRDYARLCVRIIFFESS